MNAWLRFLIVRSQTRHSSAGTTKRRSYWPRLEALEARDVPTVAFDPVFGPLTAAPSHNGPVLSNTPVYLIFEGNYWNNPSAITRDDVINTVNNILGSHYLDRATQYGPVGGAHLAGTLNDNALPTITLLPQVVPAFYRADLIDVAHQNVLNLWNVPSAQPLYFVVTAPGVVQRDNLNSLGFHNELAFNFLGLIPEQIPYGWVGINGASRDDQLAHFGSVFSHEVVEAVTDPYLETNDTNRFYNGKDWNANGKLTKDELADFEPGGLRYDYRLGNGAVVQAYWSDGDGKFVVPDGNAQVFSLHARYGTNPDTLKLDRNQFLWDARYDLTIDGDQLANKDDTIRIEAITSGVQAGGVRVTLNGEVAAFAATDLHNIIVNTRGGSDTVDVESLPAKIGLTINLGSGTDVVNLGGSVGQLDTVIGAVDIHGGSATSTVSVNDRGTADRWGFNSVHHTVGYVVQDGMVSRHDNVVTHNGVRNLTTTESFYSVFTFDGISHIDLFGGHSLNSFNVTAYALTTPLSVWGGSAADKLAFNDGGDSDDFRSTYSLDASRITRQGLSFANADGRLALLRTATVSFYDVPVVWVNGDRTDSDWHVLGVGGDTQVNLVPGFGQNTFYVGDDANTLDGIAGGLNILGRGTNTLVLDDRAVHDGDGFANAVTFDLADGRVIRTNTVTIQDFFGPLTFTSLQTINYSGVASLVVNGGSSGNTFIVENPTTAVTVNGGGSDTLDYSLYATGVAVNLTDGTASGLAGVSGVANVIGTPFDDLIIGDGQANNLSGLAGNDILVGLAGGDRLSGGEGRDLLAGGQGADELDGGAEEDVLVAGGTAYDSDPAALTALMAEWSRTDLLYGDRVAHLTGGGGLNGDNLLNLAAYTADGGGNTLTGGADALDLFYGSKAQDVNDWDADAGEVFIEPVTIQDQTITFEGLADRTYGEAPFALNATASSGLAVSYRVVSGPATLADNILTITGAGVVTVEASQAGDDVAFAGATPVEQSFTVNRAQLTITADNQARVFGQADPVFTATITGFVNGQTLADSGVTGDTAFTTNATAASPVGVYAITPSLGTLAADNYDFALFVAGSLKVSKAGTTVVLRSSATPASAGQPITFTATVAAAGPGAGVPDGTVTFKDGATVLGTGTLKDGVATFQTANLAIGSHSITAVYGGNSNFTSKTSAALTQKVLQASKTTLQSSLASSTFGQSITLTAAVAAAAGLGTPTGTVTFLDGATTLGTATLSGGKATFSTALLQAGSHALTAVYAGNTTFGGSTSAALTQTVKQAATTVALTSSAATAVFGQSITLTAKISVTAPGAGVPGGTVTFKDGLTVLGTVTLSNGAAALKTAKLSKGKHTLTVVYNGEANFTGSGSTALTVTIN